MRPICRVTDEIMFGWIEVNIIEMHGEVVIVPNRVLRTAALPNPTFAATGHHRGRGSALGRDFTKASLIARQRLGKSTSPWGSVPLPDPPPLAGEGRVWVVGKEYPGIDMKRGERAHPANRGAQPVDPGHQEIGATVEQVHCEEKRSAGDSIAAIIRHARSMPGLRIRRNALRYSALRLLEDRCARSPAAIMSATARFQGSRRDCKTHPTASSSDDLYKQAGGSTSPTRRSHTYDFRQRG